MHGLGGAAQPANVIGNTPFGEDVKRRAVLLGKHKSVDTIDR